MAVKNQIIDFSELDFDRVVADIEEIRAYNPQRFEMEQLTAVVFDDVDRGICVGYKDLTDKEFWVRGHMPAVPIMPGVVMLEAAAQLCAFHTQKHGLMGEAALGFGGLEDVRFRDIVRPGNRFVVMGEKVRVRPGSMVISRFQGFVNESLVVEGRLKGIPLPLEELRSSVAT